MANAPLPTPLTPAMHLILLALLDGDRHGYAIMQAAEALTDGTTRLGPGTLYGSIRKLIEAGLIEETGERPDPEHDDERRRYYRIAGAGRRAVAAETDRLERLVDYARPLLRAL
ncbi:MAG TPA: PadR family transcriptional regulator [Luteimonas sp.]|jgi:DNA-binding PadR family transcriptional regulator|nr:PadR family transcriptional regulator [Luteimonas sp.]